jgi:L-ascorbate metabolism protein UlaG (beta-lactamase superfamily)
LKIVWLGHSSFKVVLDSGKVIVFDPYDDTYGYQTKPIQADLVLSSHDHHDHNCLDYIIGDYTLVNQPGDYVFGDIQVKGFETFHDKSGGKERGLNTVFKVTAEGVNLMHLGDLGEVPGSAFLNSLGKVDILFLPVGGRYSLDAIEALSVMDGISPNIIIPMHYLTEAVTLKLDPLARFLETIDGIYDYAMLGKNTFSAKAGDLKKRSRVIIMEYT